MAAPLGPCGRCGHEHDPDDPDNWCPVPIPYEHDDAACSCPGWEPEDYDEREAAYAGGITPDPWRVPGVPDPDPPF